MSGPIAQDWEPVVIRKKAPTSAARKDEKAVNAARRAGAEIETIKKLTRSQTEGFTKEDVMSRIKAKAAIKKEIKVDAGKPPHPRVESSTSKVSKPKSADSEAKNRKIDEVDIDKEVWKIETALSSMEELNKNVEGASKKATNLVTFLLGELEIKADKIKILEQRCKFEGNRAVKAEKEAEVYANECKVRAKKIEDSNKLVLELSDRLSTIEADRSKELGEAKEKFINDAAKTMLETKVEMMQDFQDGKHLAWNIEEARGLLKMFTGEEGDGDEVNSPALNDAPIQDDAKMQWKKRTSLKKMKKGRRK